MAEADLRKTQIPSAAENYEAKLPETFKSTACPLSGRNSTYRPVQISAAGSLSRPNVLEAAATEIT
jgi:hypothetical protein